jgi:catechol 2,3-dioxygenase-like lactoylglutathione lyase family enzyme
MISPNGIAHIQLTVRDVAASRQFYHKLLHETFGVAISRHQRDRLCAVSPPIRVI